MNKIVLVGRLTRDPELRYTQNGTAVTKFTLAVNRPFTNQDGQREADFIDIIVWRAQAENCANYLRKGRLVGVEGRLQIRTYETQDGQKRKAAEVVADRVEFLERAREGTGIPGGSSEGFSDGFGDEMGGLPEDDAASSGGDMPF